MNIINKKLLIFGLIVLSGNFCFGMQRLLKTIGGNLANAASQIPLDKLLEGVGKGFNAVGQATANGIDSFRKAREEEAARKRAEIKAQREADEEILRQSWRSKEEKELAHKRIAAADARLLELQAQEDKDSAELKKMALNTLNSFSGMPGQAFNAFIEGAKKRNEMEGERDKAMGVAFVEGKARVEAAEKTAKAEGDAKIANTKQILDFFGDKKKVAVAAGGAALIIAAGFAAKEGFKLGADYLRHLYRNPELAQETSMVGFWERTKDRLLGNKIVTDKVEDVVLSPDLAERIKSLAEATKQSVENNTHFRNILFYGPPGTGKTMLAKKIARASGLHYIYFSAADITQFSAEEAIMKLRELFDFAKMQTERKLMIIIDEAEVILPDRNKSTLSEKTRLILNELLTFFGTETKDYLLVALTNRAQDLDSAALSRFDEQVEIYAPNTNERNLIIKKYVNDFITTPPTEQGRRLTILGRILELLRRFGHKIGFSKPKSTQRLIVEPDALGDDMMRQLTERTAGFVGRDISKMILAMQVTALSSKDRTLTKDMILRILKQKIDQKQKESAGFRFA